jgi:hypothetical protein
MGGKRMKAYRYPARTYFFIVYALLFISLTWMGCGCTTSPPPFGKLE